MEAERQYLVHALSGMLDSNALEPVVEYLLSFPKDQPHHVLEYLTELLGHQPVRDQDVGFRRQEKTCFQALIIMLFVCATAAL